MPYVVSYKPVKGREISLDQILTSEVLISKPRKKRNYPGSVTRYYESTPDWLYTKSDITRMIRKIAQFNAYNSASLNCAHLEQYYKFFKIPKKSGGLRDICAPTGILYDEQKSLKEMFEKDFHVVFHTSAFAYTKGRSILNCMQRHQANSSKWFLKLDFSDFFGSTNKEFVLSELSLISPFSEIMQEKEGKKELSKALDICFLENKLPQGTPISPLLTNLIMIPIDHEINKRLHKLGFTYTRYADDMQISSSRNFSYSDVIKIIKDVLINFKAPYVLKDAKTRYGSVSGRNWNLGLMLNKDNNITIGHVTHKIIKSQMTNFILDTKFKNGWTRVERDKLNGTLGYFKFIEPKYAKYLINHYNKKYQVNIEKLLRSNV